jgi:hypothetical protein
MPLIWLIIQNSLSYCCSILAFAKLHTCFLKHSVGTVLLGTVLVLGILLSTVLLGTVLLGTVLVLGTALLGTVLLGKLGEKHLG